MPRTIVMIRPIVCNNGTKESDIETKIASLVLSYDFLCKTGVVFEYYMRVFGWPDYVVSLYGPNENLLKQAILTLREHCGAIITSSIVGVCPEDAFFTIAELNSSQIKEALKTAKDKIDPREERAVLATIMNLEVAKEYISFHKALLELFYQVIVKKSNNNSPSEIEKDEKAMKCLLEKVFFSNKDFSDLEKQSFLNKKKE